MKTLFKLFFIPFFLVLSFSSCRMLRPSIMLKTPKNYPYAQLDDSLARKPYKISVADLLRISISPNDGFNKVNFTIENAQNIGREYLDILVEIDGKIKLPLIGRIYVVGKTTRQLEDEIESLYQNYYIKPFVTIQVMNRRAMVFGGNGGTGRAIPLVDYNTTLFELLAQSGGIYEDGKAYKVKLIRNEGPKPKVYLIDLSTIDGLEQGNTIIMANDIVYVEPRLKVVQKLTQEIVPYVTLLTTTLLVISLFNK